MAGGTLNHNRIAQNVGFSLRKVKQSHCDVFIENVKLEAIKNFYHPSPDVMLTCNTFDLRQKNKIAHPSLIVEVLSNSTEKHDKTTKLKHYKGIASVQYYMLVSPYEKCVEIYRRVNNFLWNYEEFNEQNPQIELPKLEITISISDIYENIIFEKEDEDIKS